MHTFWINRNARYVDGNRVSYGSILKHGEFHWRYARPDRHDIGGSIAWHWGTTLCHLSFTCDTGDGYEFVGSLGIPWLLAVCVTHSMPFWLVKYLPQHHYRLPKWGEHRPPVDGDPQVQAEIVGYEEGSYPEDREISFRIHSWAIWWALWINDHDWKSTDHKWRRGSFHIDAAVLGTRQYSCEDIGQPVQRVVHMGEGDYPVVVQQQQQRWWRTRWPWWPCVRVCNSFSVTCETGIPFPGKGENVWGCSEDGLYGTAFDVETPQQACVRFREKVLDLRRRYGGQRCAEEPWPQSAAERIKAWEARAAARQQGQVAKQGTDPYTQSPKAGLGPFVLKG